MPSERIQRRIDALLDRADEAADGEDWGLVIERAEMVLGVDPDNADAQSLITIAQRGLGTPQASAPSPPAASTPTPTTPPHPERFAGDRYEVRRHLGDGATKRVFLGTLRSGGGEVQESAGVTVKTLRMPPSAKVFIATMMLGVMLGMAQFVLYIVAASVDQPAAWFAWLGPLREVSIGLLLLGIVMVALSTWDRPQACRFVGVLVDAIVQVGAPSPTHIPDGPNFFHLCR